MATVGGPVISFSTSCWCLRGEDLRETGAPGVEGALDFGAIGVAVVDGGDAAFFVVEDLGDGESADAHGRHRGGGGAAQIVDLEVGKAGGPTEALVGVVKVAEVGTGARGKQPLP